MVRRRRGRATLRRLRRLFKPGPVGHTRKGVAYHIGNSIQGLRWMFRIGKRKADRDVLVTKDGVLVNSHWARPLAHGFTDPSRKYHRLAKMDTMLWADVRHFHAKGGYRINTLETDLREMGRLGMRAVLEPKDGASLAKQEYWDHVADWGRKYDVPLTGYALKGNAAAIPFMRAAGIPTKQLWR